MRESSSLLSENATPSAQDVRAELRSMMESEFGLPPDEVAPASLRRSSSAA